MGKKFMVEQIPDDIHKRFKATCVLSGKTMSQRIIELMDASSRTVIVSEHDEFDADNVLPVGATNDGR